MTKKSFVALATLLCGAAAFATPGAYTQWFANAVPNHPTGWTGGSAVGSAPVTAVAVTSDNSATFTAAAAAGTDYAKETVTLTSGAMDFYDLPAANSTELTGAKFAFVVAQKEGTDATPFVYVFSAAGWEKTSITAADGVAKTVTVTYCKSAKTFTVDGEPTVYASLESGAGAGTDWIATAFIGNGSVNALSGEKAAEIVATVDGTEYETLSGALAAVAANGGALDIKNNVAATIQSAPCATITSLASVGSVTFAAVDGAATYAVSGAIGATGGITVASGVTLTISAKPTGNVTIENGGTLVLTAGASLDKTQVTNNGTIRIQGGTMETPIVINDNGAANTGFGGSVEIAADSVLRNYATNQNKLYKVTGAGAENGSVLILDSAVDWGMTDGTEIRNCKVITTSKKFWFEHPSAFDATVDFEVGSQGLQLGWGSTTPTFDIGSLSGSGAISLTSSPKLSLHMDRCDSAYTGTTSVPIAITGEHTLTLTTSYTGALSGDGTVAYGNGLPATGSRNSLKMETWTGTLWITNYNWTSFDLAEFGHAGSTVRMTGVTGYSKNNNNDGVAGFDGTLELVDDGTTKALTLNDTWSSTYYFAHLKGDGTFAIQDNTKTGPGRYAVKDTKGFTGTFAMAGSGRTITIGDVSAATDYVGVGGACTFTVKSGTTLDVSEGTFAVTGPAVAFGGTLTVKGAAVGATVIRAASFTGKPIVSVLDAEGGLVSDTCLLKVVDGAIATVQAEAKYDGTLYEIVQEAITAAGDENVGSVVVYGTPTLPAGYAIVTAAGGEKTLRKAGTIYYVDGNIYQSQANFTTGTGSTTYVAGDTIVIDADHTSATEAYFKANLPYAKFRIAKDFTIHSGDNDAILLANAEIEVVEGKTLTFNVGWSHPFKLGSATFTGAGTVVMDGILLNAATEAFTSEGWTGTVWLKNIGATGNSPLMDGRFAKLGRAGSTVKMSDCNGYINMEGDFAFDLELEGTGWKNPSGFYTRTHAFGALKGSGTLDGAAFANSFCRELLRFSDASSFTGSLNAGNSDTDAANYKGKRLVIGSGDCEDIAGLIHVNAGKSVTVAQDKVWTAVKMQMNGTLGGSGTIEAALTFADGATLVKGDAPITVNGSVTFGSTLNVTGASVGDTVLTVTGTKPASLPTIVGDAEHLLEWDGNSLVYRKVPDPEYGEPVVTEGANPQAVVVTVPTLHAVGQTVKVTISDAAGVQVGEVHQVVVSGNSTQVTIDTGLDANTSYNYTVTVGETSIGSGSFATGYDNVWYGADAATDTVVGGNWVEDQKPAISDGNYVINSATGNKFAVAADKGAGNLAVLTQVVTFTSAIDSEELADISVGDAAGGLTVANVSGTLKWMGVVRGVWTQLQGDPTSVMNTPVTITVEYDRSETPNVIRYKVGETTLGTNTLAEPVGFTGVTAVGSGKIKSLEGTIGEAQQVIDDKYTATALADKPLVVDAAFARELGANKAAVQKALNTATGSGLKGYEAYVLGVPAEKLDEPLVISGVQDSEPTTMTLTDGFTKRTDAGVTVTRTVKTKATADAEWTTDGAATQNADGVTIDLPAEGPKAKYIKIEYTFE